MQVFRHLHDLRNYRTKLRREGQTLGFVPTMGALHQGHLALVKRALSENNASIVTIFVNPTQFNNAEDLEKYPRREVEDLRLLEGIGNSIVFMPSVEEVYGTQVNSDPFDLHGLDRGMEGDHRPGHFQGVATIVKRFFEMIEPERAYFGEKDYQQLRIVQQVAVDYQLPVEVIGCETERYPSGLAMSSRNYRLSEQGLQAAVIIYEQMQYAIHHHKNYSPAELSAAIEAAFAKSSLELEYVSFADADTMDIVEDWQNHRRVRIFIAAFCEGVRLIDNLCLYED